MNEEYINNLYTWISSVDSGFTKDFSSGDFYERMEDAEYVSQIYNWIASVDSGFTKDFDLNKFKEKLGFVDLSNIKLETTIPSFKDY